MTNDTRLKINNKSNAGKYLQMLYMWTLNSTSLNNHMGIKKKKKTFKTNENENNAMRCC